MPVTANPPAAQHDRVAGRRNALNTSVNRQSPVPMRNRHPLLMYHNRRDIRTWPAPRCTRTRVRPLSGGSITAAVTLLSAESSPMGTGTLRGGPFAAIIRLLFMP